MKQFLLRLSSTLFRWALSLGSNVWTGLMAEIARQDRRTVPYVRQPLVPESAGETRPLTAEEKHAAADAWLQEQLLPAVLPEPVRRRIIQAAVLYRRLTAIL